jgi:hypothetical protein
MTLVVKDVPAQVCDNCGEEYLDADVSARLRETLEEEAKAGVEVVVCRYVAA